MQTSFLSSADHSGLYDPLEIADLGRIDLSRRLDPVRRAELGQFLTPSPVARLMASMFTESTQSIDLLDAGAGAGALTAAFVARCCAGTRKPTIIRVTAVEIDPGITPALRRTLAVCDQACQNMGIKFESRIIERDFVDYGLDCLSGSMFAKRESFNRVILNPPYTKIHSASRHRRQLRRLGIETSNLYTAFVAIGVGLLEPQGELVAITPRSFCNGPYFRPFRELFLKEMVFRRIHIFEMRNAAFSDDAVLQENIVYHAVKHGEKDQVLISSSLGTDDGELTERSVHHSQVVSTEDPNLFIHIAASGLDQLVVDQMHRLTHSLADLGLTVSTGRVVDFRAKEYLRHLAAENSVPLIYPGHFERSYVRWPKPNSKKPNAIVACPETSALLLPTGVYVLTKRFTSKEEPRRVVAAIFDPELVPSQLVGFENHLNVFHIDNAGLPTTLARGLALFLNSSLVDAYLRQFNGHTQVNATDLRSLNYPSRRALERIGEMVDTVDLPQETLDEIIGKELLDMVGTTSVDPFAAQRKIEDALSILAALDLPREQQNERSALTLLALIDLKPHMSWADATSPCVGITQMMDYMRQHYGKVYAPNTRETVRRQTIHQFVAAGLAIPNPDDPNRPVNSPNNCYQIQPLVLELLRTYGTTMWESRLRAYLENVVTLRERYARRRKKSMVPVEIPGGRTIELTPGKHNELIKAIITDFGPRFVPGGKVLYVGDTGDKFALFDETTIRSFGIKLDSHGKMPDVIMYDEHRDWLILIEAVTSHGPVNGKRRDELQRLFEKARPGLVYVTAFLDRRELAKEIKNISWATEVWIANSPEHLIHFDGERFLGPYEDN